MFLLNSTYDYPYYISKDRIFFDYLEALKNCDSKKEVNDGLSRVDLIVAIEVLVPIYK